VRVHLLAKRLQLASGKPHLTAMQFCHHVTVAAGSVCLLFEWAELTAHLAQQVLDSGEVGFGSDEATLRLLASLAELQNTRSFFDDQSSIFWAGVEHCVDLALTDDDVLGTADAGVGQQLLDVEQPTRHPVECVLAVAGTEECARDLDLVELGRQHSIGVVDGQRHLCATQRGALGSTGEDDIVHLLGPHRARSLCTEHPSDRVDHVGLTAAIGADHDGDAWFELEVNRVRERLEALHRQRFQIHNYAPGDLDVPPARRIRTVSRKVTSV